MPSFRFRVNPNPNPNLTKTLSPTLNLTPNPNPNPKPNSKPNRNPNPNPNQIPNTNPTPKFNRKPSHNPNPNPNPNPNSSPNAKPNPNHNPDLYLTLRVEMGLLNPIFFHQEVSLGTPAVVDPNELNYTTPVLEARMGARVKKIIWSLKNKFLSDQILLSGVWPWPRSVEKGSRRRQWAEGEAGRGDVSVVQQDSDRRWWGEEASGWWRGRRLGNILPITLVPPHLIMQSTTSNMASGSCCTYVSHTKTAAPDLGYFQTGQSGCVCALVFPNSRPAHLLLLASDWR